MSRAFACVLAITAASCGAGPSADDDAPDGGLPPCAPGECEIDILDSATGCGGVYNPDQLLDYRITTSHWSSVVSGAGDTYYPAQFACGDEPPLPFEVGIRRKRSGGTDKPGLKIDFNVFAAGGEYLTLRKMSFENGVSSGSSGSEPRDAVGEYLAWRMMNRAGALASRATLARVWVNDELIGVYANVEQVDKRFLRTRGHDDEGWLFKLSGGDTDGYKTNETTPNPYEDRLCFWDKNPCPMPSAEELSTYLPEHLDIDQMMRFGGVNALIANSDGPWAKDNNFYFYDDPAGGPRLYLPWDLDTTLKGTPDLMAPSTNALYTDVLFTHWEDDHDRLWTELLATAFVEADVHAELDRVMTVAGDALASDPTATGESMADHIATLHAWWTARLAQVDGELAAHAP